MVARYPPARATHFGNLANRVLHMAVNYCDGLVPATRADGPLVEHAATAFATLTARLEDLDYAGGFGAVWELIRNTNSYIEERQPWALNKAGDTAAVDAVLGDCLEALRIVALLASPLIPRAARELWRRLGLTGAPGEQRLPEAAGWGGLPAGAPLEKGAPLFPRIETAAQSSAQ
jgi:methionyl-tRNA synthetase